ncbi:MAG: hypothetical protein AB7P76_13050 [Candidatus Melainabacteria bacterium]
MHGVVPHAARLPGGARPGMTIIEAAVIMAMVALAIAPIVQMIGGPMGGDGNVSRVSGLTNKNMVFANASIERALAGELAVMTCAGGMTLPVKGGPVKSCQGVDATTSSAPIYYEWIVENKSSLLPDAMQNDIYDATLNVYADSGYSQTLFTLPTTIFHNTGYTAAAVPRTGIMFILDASGSMGANGTTGWPSVANGLNNYGETKWKASAPFFKYQYTDPAYPAYTPPTAGLNIDNDAQLDVVSYRQTDNLDTTYDDRYPRLGAPLKTGQLPVSNCNDYRTSSAFDFQNLNEINSYAPTLGAITAPDTKSISNKRFIVETMCGVSSDALLPALYTDYMSRIEVARTSFLKFLLTVESDPQFAQNIKLGFFSFYNNVDHHLPGSVGAAMENANGSNRFPEMRRKLSWINREGPGGIMASNQTNTWQAVYDASMTLLNQGDIDNRIILVLTDGVMSGYFPCAFNNSDPQNAQDSRNCFLNNGGVWGGPTGLTRALGQGTVPGYPGKKVTIHTVGVLEDDEAGVLIPLLKEGMSDPTGGTYAYAKTVSEIEGVLEAMKYTILKQSLLSQVARYGISAN